MNESMNECKHKYEPVIKKEQKIETFKQGTDSKYNSIYGKDIIEIEHIFIYCVKCGDSKQIDLQITNNNYEQ